MNFFFFCFLCFSTLALLAVERSLKKQYESELVELRTTLNEMKQSKSQNQRDSIKQKLQEMNQKMGQHRQIEQLKKQLER